jgi:cbb3-type cytochrome oxidase maturation protein
MEALYLLIPLSVMLVALAVWIFFGAAESGQFEDLEGPGMRILVDDDRTDADAACAAAQRRGGERVGGAQDAG